MKELDHKYNALLAMDYWIIEHEKIVGELAKADNRFWATQHTEKLISEMRASRKFFEENK